jgi:hypothetical protein
MTFYAATRRINRRCHAPPIPARTTLFEHSELILSSGIAGSMRVFPQ